MIAFTALTDVSTFAAAFAPFLLAMIAKSTVVLVAAIVVLRLMRRGAAASRHLLLALTSASVLLLPLLSVTLPGWSVLPGTRGASDLAASRRSADMSRAEWDRAAVDASSVPSAEPAVPFVATRQSSSTESNTTAATPMPVRGVQNARATGDGEHRHDIRTQLASLFVVIWVFGVAVAALAMSLGLVSLWRLRRQSRRLTDGPLADMLHPLRDQLGIRRKVELYQTAQRAIPLTWGTLHPRIVLPNAAERWSESRRRVVLLHELAHVRRFDCLAQLISHSACVVLWFNPLMWFVRKRMIEERERACDDVVLNSGLRPSDYAQHLLRVASGVTFYPLTASTAVAMAHTTEMESRIMAILDHTRSRRSPSRKIVVLGVAGVALISSSLAMMRQAARADEEPPKPLVQQTASKPNITTLGQVPRCQMTGTVTAADTGEAVADVEIKVMTGKGRDKATVASTVSGADGSYAIDVPLGHARGWFVTTPTGYWLPYREMMISFATTRAKPIHTKHYVLQKGTAWPIRMLTGPEKRPVAGARATLVRENEYISSAETDRGGHATLTFPDSGGEFRIAISALGAGGRFGVLVSLRCDSGFQPGKIESVAHEAQADTYELTDVEGKTASVQGAAVVERDGQATVVFTAEPPESRAQGKLTGTVVDPDGKPIEGAHVALGFSSNGGSSMSSAHHAETDDSGQFEIPAISLESRDGKPTRLIVVVTKEGYGCRDLGPRPFRPDEAGLVEEMQPITLAPAASIRGVVVDPDGKPVEGAWVEPSSGYADRTQFTRTDSEGRFEVTNLSPDLHQIRVSYAHYYAGDKFVADAGVDEVLIRLRAPGDRRRAAAAPPEKIKVGAIAPDLKVEEWTDGQTHRLSDYRGKLVFLEFWGTWCSACINGFPALSGLIERYESSNVAFLGIHTSGTDLAQVGRLLELKGLPLVTGLDQGSDKRDSSTFNAYGVRGCPTQIIIDREGRVVWNGHDQKGYLLRSLRAAKELGIRDPYAKDMSFEEKVEIQNKANLHVMSQIIDELLER